MPDSSAPHPFETGDIDRAVRSCGLELPAGSIAGWPDRRSYLLDTVGVAFILWRMRDAAPDKPGKPKTVGSLKRIKAALHDLQQALSEYGLQIGEDESAQQAGVLPENLVFTKEEAARAGLSGLIDIEMRHTLTPRLAGREDAAAGAVSTLEVDYRIPAHDQVAQRVDSVLAALDASAERALEAAHGVKRKPRKRDAAIVAFLADLAGAWAVAYEREPGAGWNPYDNSPQGPFQRFAEECLRGKGMGKYDPERGDIAGPLRDRVREALKMRKDRPVSGLDL